MITKLDSSQYGFSPKHFFVYNGNLFFSAHDKIHGIELWSTDGTKNGEHILIDINPGKDSSMPDNFFIYNSKLYFTANDGTHGFELWVTNGTSAGIHIVKDLHKGTGDSYPHNLTLYNNQIYFVASDSANGTSLAHSDGSDTGTNILAPTFATMKYPLIDNHGIVPYNNTLYFNANYTILDNELWSFFDTSFHTNTSFVYIDKNIFRSYPNPLSANILNLEFQNIPGGELNINLISMDGKIMLNQKIATPDKYIQIELPAKISNGMYILQMSTEKDIHYQKIIVQH